MKRSSKILTGFVTLAIATTLVYFGWWTSAPQTVSNPASVAATAPVPVPVFNNTAPAAVASAPAIRHPIEAIEVTPSAAKVDLPTLQETDAYVRQALSDFVNAKDIVRFLQLTQFVTHWVATVDNLPRAHAAVALWPVTPMPGRFRAGTGDDDQTPLAGTIHPDNQQRYSPFVAFVEAIDTNKVIALYVHLYPLLQQAYRDLGYPHGSFNDRLVAVIDHLLALPVQVEPIHVNRTEVKGILQLRAPWVTYQFTDPALNDLSAGHKILLRTGPVNHQHLRTKLMAIRAQLTGVKE